MIEPLVLTDSHVVRDPAANRRDSGDVGLAAGWALLHEAGAAIAVLADLDEETNILAPRDFAMRAAAGGPARLIMAEQMIDDCAATLHAGLTALMRAIEGHRDVTAAALMLWREFDRARCALRALTTPPH